MEQDSRRDMDECERTPLDLLCGAPCSVHLGHSQFDPVCDLSIDPIGERRRVRAFAETAYRGYDEAFVHMSRHWGRLTARVEEPQDEGGVAI